jgi:prepilin-type processing-associated H-X9-DG protein
MDRDPPLRNRCGVTRPELLVGAGMSILAIGLLLPALVGAAHMSRRTDSTNNLRKIGDGLHAYHATFGFFPSNGGPPPEAVTTPDVRTVYPDGMSVRWGFGEPGRSGRLQTGSYAYAIMPFVGEEETYRKQRHDNAVKIYYIPARRPAVAREVPAKDPVHVGRYAVTAGLNPWGRSDYAANDQIVRPGMGLVMRRAEITDGLAETIFVGEKAMDLRDIKNGSEYWDQGIILGGCGCTGRKGKKLLRDADDLGERLADNWGSPEPAGVHFLFADGHVRLLGYKTSEELIWALMTPAGDDDVDITRLEP